MDKLDEARHWFTKSVESETGDMNDIAIVNLYAQQAIAAALIALVERMDDMTTKHGQLMVSAVTQDWNELHG